MSAPFYDYVRGRTDQVPPGYSDNGMRAYRHLVYLGASQMVEAHFPELREQLGEDAWRDLMAAFVRDSRWSSPYYGDMKDAFLEFIQRESTRED
ncbi:HvfC/BufC family peptide modification chaperone [Comamonas koreensis]|uniref:DNA-binding domain-containing protein n=1 Tax=Comamonas koreensis TaxID=160825 RepID=A0AAW4Y011_9BURK|nr:putative DNA-binding domain-containing protein [Comamonas koreensis]MCD2166251.1 putative DNA-binding domain-containing protein [Comamonas koreensis]